MKLRLKYEELKIIVSSNFLAFLQVSHDLFEIRSQESTDPDENFHPYSTQWSFEGVVENGVSSFTVEKNLVLLLMLLKNDSHSFNWKNLSYFSP